MKGYWWLGAYLEVLINIPNIDTNLIAYSISHKDEVHLRSP